MISKIYSINMLNVLKYVYNSEKSNRIFKEFNILTFKVNKNSNKIEIKNSIKYLFNLKVKKINIINNKKKSKKLKNNIIGYKKSWKKAFVFLESNQNLIYLNKLDKINKELLNNEIFNKIK